MVEGTGFEPVYATRADLQSAAFNHSATPPARHVNTPKERAYARKVLVANIVCSVNPPNYENRPPSYENRPPNYENRV